VGFKLWIKLCDWILSCVILAHISYIKQLPSHTTPMVTQLLWSHNSYGHTTPMVTQLPGIGPTTPASQCTMHDAGHLQRDELASVALHEGVSVALPQGQHPHCKGHHQTGVRLCCAETHETTRTVSTSASRQLLHHTTHESHSSYGHTKPWPWACPTFASHLQAVEEIHALKEAIYKEQGRVREMVQELSKVSGKVSRPA